MGLFHWLSGLFGGAGENGARTSETRTNGDAAAAGDPPTDAAAALVEEAAEAGYDLDYSPESLTELDALVDGLAEDELDAVGRPITAYLGEVFVRNYEGEWTVTDEIGWVVDLTEVSPGSEENLFVVPYAVEAAIEGDVTFAQVHDDGVAGLDVDGPTLSDEPVGGQDRPDGAPLEEEAVQQYREQAAELVETAEEYDLDYSVDSLAELDRLIAEVYDMTPEDVDREQRLAESQPGAVPDGAKITIGSGGATAQIAGYVGEVFARAYDAEWYGGEGLDSVVIETDDQTLELDVEFMVNVAYRGYVSFEQLHESLVGELEPTAGE